MQQKTYQYLNVSVTYIHEINNDHEPVHQVIFFLLFYNVKW